jgi:hypothetical protein
MNDLGNIKNFGPYMVKIMNHIGIHSREDLMDTDYKTIKKNLINAGVTPHLNIFYSIDAYAFIDLEEVRYLTRE